MKYALSISVATAAVFAAVCLSLSPQKYLYEWALNQILDEPSYTMTWENGTANLENLVFKWPERDLSNSWLDAIAFSFIENTCVNLQNGLIEISGKTVHLNGFYEPLRSHLVVQEGDTPILTLQKEQGSQLCIFNGAPLSLLQPFGDFKDFKGIITKGFVDENKKGNLEIANFSYQQNQFQLTCPQAFVELTAAEAKIMAVEIALSFEEQPLWSINPLAIHLKLERGLPFTVATSRTTQFIDERLNLYSYVKNLKMEGSLKPAKIDLFSFDKSLLIPFDDESILQLTHETACHYQTGQKSHFSLIGEEVCCEIAFGKEKQFSLEFSEYLLKKLGLTNLPLKKMVGTIDKEGALWKVVGLVEHGKVDAYFTSLLLPQLNLKEAYLSMNKWMLHDGPDLEDVFVHYTPEKTVWRANYEGLAFQGSGHFFDGMDIKFQGSGSLGKWRKIVAQLNPDSPLIDCPLEGFCIIYEGSLVGDEIQLVGVAEKCTLGDLKNIHYKFAYENGIFTMQDITGSIDYKGKEYALSAPKITYGDSLQFDGWIADQGHEYVRLAGIGSFERGRLHLEFDRSKTHLLNIIPDFFSAELKNWNEIEVLEFIGQGPFRTPFFEDLNRWTHHADWNIALFYEQQGFENEFQIVKGPLLIKGKVNNLQNFEISELSLNTPFFALNGAGQIDLQEMVLRLDPVAFNLNFDETVALQTLPLQGRFSAIGNLVAKTDYTESWLEILPDQLSYGALSVPNQPFYLHQKEEELSFKCDFIFNEKLFTGFDCLMDKKGLKAKNFNTSFYVGNTHFGIERSDLVVRGRHTPAFALIEPVNTHVETVKSLLPFELAQIEGGTLYLDNTHCCIKETQFLGKEIEQIDFDFETLNSEDLLLKNIAFKNEGESVTIPFATLSFDKGQLDKITTPLVQAQNISFDALMITKFNVQNFESERPFNAFLGTGKVVFSNLLPLLADSIRPDEVAELSYIDTKWFLPNQGEIAFEATKEKCLIHELKDCFSRGKMIRFELNSDPQQIASLLWDGSVELPLKLKPQHLSFKWSELFCLNLHGTLRDPHLELKKK